MQLSTDSWTGLHRIAVLYLNYTVNVYKVAIIIYAQINDETLHNLDNMLKPCELNIHANHRKLSRFAACHIDVLHFYRGTLNVNLCP